MGKKRCKAGTMLHPLPVVMVSCGDGEKDNITTIAWTGIVNSQPPMTYVSIRESRLSHEIISKTGEFVINLPNESLVHATDFCGVHSGRNADKFAELKLNKEYGDWVSCPMIGEAPVSLECKVVSITKLGSHDMFLAEILGVSVEEAWMDSKGQIELEKADLIAYSQKRYVGLQKKELGTFGYSLRESEDNE